MAGGAGRAAEAHALRCVFAAAPRRAPRAAFTPSTRAGIAEDGDRSASDEITEAEFALIMDRKKIFSAAGIPTEGKMYDVVAKSDGAGLLGDLT